MTRLLARLILLLLCSAGFTQAWATEKVLTYENGQVKARYNYDDSGRLDGSYMVFHENGIIKTSGAYAKGSKVGTWVQCNDKGDTTSLGTIGPDGALRLEGRFDQALAWPAVLRTASTERVPRRGTAISGACLFGTVYGAAALAGIMTARTPPYTSDANMALYMLIPVAGPITFWVADDAPWTFPEWMAPCGMTLAQVLGILLYVKGKVGSRSVVVAPTIDRNGTGVKVALSLRNWR